MNNGFDTMFCNEGLSCWVFTVYFLIRKNQQLCRDEATSSEGDNLIEAVGVFVDSRVRLIKIISLPLDWILSHFVIHRCIVHDRNKCNRILSCKLAVLANYSHCPSALFYKWEFEVDNLTTSTYSHSIDSLPQTSYFWRVWSFRLTNHPSVRDHIQGYRAPDKTRRTTHKM